MTSRTKIIGAVEIGTSKIVVLVGEISGGRTLNIIGRGECNAQGVIKGQVVDFKTASERVHTALHAAETTARTRIDEIYLAQTGAHLDGFYNEAAVNVAAADNMVSQLDIDTVCSLAKSKELPAGRAVIHHIRRPFRLDGVSVPDPECLKGHRLEVGYWTVHGSEPKISDHIHVITGFSLRVGELILSSLASGSLLTTAEDRMHGCLVIDIGCGTTDYVLYRDGFAHTTGILPVAGDHFTNDLSLGLRLSSIQAEKLKVRHGSAVVKTRDRGEKVWLNGDLAIGDRQFPKIAIEQITSARAWELLEVVKKKMGPAFVPEKCGAGIVLTGAAAKMPGMEEAAAKVFGVSARLGESPTWVKDDLRDPGYTTALGLLYYGLNATSDSNRSARRSRGFLGRVTQMFANS